MAVQVSSSVARTYFQVAQDFTPGLRPVTMSSLVPKEDITLTHSSYHLMLRILAWVIGFFDNVKLPPSKRNLTVYLSAVEMNTAEVKVIKLHQQLYFTSELNILRKNFTITKHIIYSLC